VVKKYSTTGLPCSRRDASVSGSASGKVRVNSGARCPTLLPTSGDVEASDTEPLVGVGVGAELPLALSVGVEDFPGGDSVFPPHDAAANSRSASVAGHKRAMAWPVLLERNSNFMGWCG
jgi:hypothetical protein